MAQSAESRILAVMEQQRDALLAEWVSQQQKVIGRSGIIPESELRAQCARVLDELRDALRAGARGVQQPAMESVRALLGEISRDRAQRGFTPGETASFIFSLKRVLFERLRAVHGADAAALTEAMWTATEILDGLGLYTTEVYQKGRDQVIRRQQQDMLELSTPVVSLWDGVLALPLIGTLDSSRTQIVMEALLQRIVDTEADIAILDITGVPTVDTLTAQHLIKTVTAARLMGADCIISGIRPQIAQTIVHLGVDLSEITTKATLADAFRLALQRIGASITARTERRV